MFGRSASSLLFQIWLFFEWLSYAHGSATPARAQGEAYATEGVPVVSWRLGPPSTEPSKSGSAIAEVRYLIACARRNTFRLTPKRDPRYSDCL
jgi:hypothetical protein